MTNDDYREIFRYMRGRLIELGFAGIDERIMSNIRASDSAFSDLTYYLKNLTDEIALGSDAQLGDVLRRARRYVQTESGEAIEGVRVTAEGQDRERFGVERVDFVPNPELGTIADDLRALINDLIEDHSGE